jgi:hypothetical protein
MSDARIKCSEIRAMRAELIRRKARIDAQISNLTKQCLHDESREEHDYQDPKPYRRCLGCGRVA